MKWRSMSMFTFFSVWKRTRTTEPTRFRMRGTRIAHAKVAKYANPTTLLTRFAEELRRAPEAGPDAGRGRRVV